MSVAPEFLKVLFPDDKPLFYQGTFNGKAYSRHWLVLDRADVNGLVFLLYLELDPKVMGSGGSIVRQRVRLEMDAAFVPTRYVTEAQGARVELKRGADGQWIVTLPDGTQPPIKGTGAEFIVEANLTGLDSILFAIARQQGKMPGDVSFTLLLLNQLLTIPYNLTHKGDGRYESSYGEDIVVAPSGLLESVAVVKQGVTSERAEAPPLPAWINERGGTVSREVVRYRKPDGATFRIDDVSIASPRGPIGATVTIPAGDGPFPAVLFLAGTGKHDRHGIAGELDLGSHEIVDYLSNNGFVGLRYDTRGAGTTKSDAAMSTGLKALIEDAHGCLAYLLGRPEVRRDKVFLVAHSQGGLIALALARDTPDAIHGLALLAAPGRGIEEILEDQLSGQQHSLAMTPEQRQKQHDEFVEFFANVRAGKKFEAGQVPDHLLPLTRATEWISEHLQMPPTELMKEVRCPVLICQGEKDFQVKRRDADLLLQAAQEAKLTVEQMIVPNVDHLFKHTPGESKLEQYYDRTRRVDGTFLGRLRDWLSAT